MSTAPFRAREGFAPSAAYRIAPVRFGRLDGDRYVVTNDVGEYVLLGRDDLATFVEHRLSPRSASYRALKAKHALFDDDSRVALDLLALKVRSRLEPLSWFTGLHIVVVTLRCDHSCHYCQVSRQTEDRAAFDMSREHADLAVAMVFRSPSPTIKIEFQGGEPLLRFDLVRHVVEQALRANEIARRDLQFVIASNLTHLTDEILTFCKENRILLSTSVDGPADLHDGQRPLRGSSSHRAAVAGIARAREVLGPDAVSALMTTTPASLGRVEEIVDEYVRLGFTSIFLRSLSPYGFATRTSLLRRTPVDEWLEFYRRGLDYILRLNAQGRALREEFTGIVLQKIFSPLGSRYVDLQSPAGMGIGALVYNYEGSVYASDEGRMLAEMGDLSLRLGHLDQAYEDLIGAEALLGTLDATMLEGAPMCSDCPFLPYCGADPTFHRATQGDVLGHKAFSAFCKKQMGVFRHVIHLLEDDPAASEILRSWV